MFGLVYGLEDVVVFVFVVVVGGVGLIVVGISVNYDVVVQDVCGVGYFEVVGVEVELVFVVFVYCNYWQVVVVFLVVVGVGVVVVVVGVGVEVVVCCVEGDGLILCVRVGVVVWVFVDVQVVWFCFQVVDFDVYVGVDGIGVKGGGVGYFVGLVE